MSTAIILLVTDGPISTIDCNVQSVVRSITCMYEQVNRFYVAYMVMIIGNTLKIGID